MNDTDQASAASQPEDTGRISFEELGRHRPLSDRVAEAVLDRILKRRLPPGSRLPSERSLAEQFGVSRTVIREAIRSLAAKGVVDIRSGRGLQVSAVDAQAVRESMALFILGKGEVDYPKVHEVRTMIEVHTAGLAAERASANEIAVLAQICDRMAAGLSDAEVASREDVEFHRVIAGATHNELWLVMLDAIADSLFEIRRATFGPDGRAPQALQDHRRILSCIKRRDTAAAREAMRIHLQAVEDALEKMASTSANAQQ